MDKFYDYLRRKYFVDYDNEEIKDISKAMDILLKRLHATFNELSEVLQIESLVPCGSMEEKTTVWGEENTAVEYNASSHIKTLEFDCVSVLQPIVSDLNMNDSCPGYKKLTSKTLSKILREKELIEESQTYQKEMSEHTTKVMNALRFMLTSKTDTVSQSTGNDADENEVPSFDTFVSQQIEEKIQSGQNVDFYQDVLRLHKFATGTSKSISTEFMIAVDSALEELCKTSEAQGDIDHEMKVYQVDMPTGTLKYGRCLPGCQLALNWKSKIKPSFDKIVYADFVPAFQVPQTNSLQDGHPPNYLVAKGCRNQDCTVGCWRLSHCLAEIKAIQTTSQSHRDVYKFLKFFNYSILSRRLDNALKSYHIKTALLSHIKSCKTESNDVTDCLCQVLNSLNSYIVNGKVPHWKDPNYSLVLRQDTCHRFVPMLLQFVFDRVVKRSPLRLFLTIRCEAGNNEMQFHKAGYRLSHLVCQILEGKDCCESLETEIEKTLIEAADLVPLFHQHPVSYSIVVEDTDSPSDTVTIYQRCMKF